MDNEKRCFMCGSVLTDHGTRKRDGGRVSVELGDERCKKFLDGNV